MLRRPLPVPFNAAVLRRDLRASVLEGSCYTLMVGVSETYFGAFLIAAGVGNFWIGVLATLPILLGSILQTVTPWGIRRMGSYRAWSVLTAGLQGLSLLALSAVCWGEATGFWVLLAILVLYWGSSMAVGPAWNTWMEFVIPRPIRARYLSRRMRICQVCLLLGVLGAGMLLQSGLSPLLVFSGMFCAGGGLRLMSAWGLGQQTEQPHWMAKHELQGRLAASDDQLAGVLRRTVPFFVAMQFAVFFSGPFFAPFMLRNLEMGYGEFMFLIVLGYLGRVLTLHWAGNFARQFGAGWLLWFGALGLVPLAGLWLVSQAWWFLVLIQLAGGMAWGCYELAMSIVFIERIPGHFRTRVLSLFGVGNGLAMVLGSLLGGWVLSGFSSSHTGFMVVFGISSLLRVGTLFLFPWALMAEAAPAAVVTPAELVSAAPEANGRPLVVHVGSLSEPPAALPEPAREGL